MIFICMHCGKTTEIKKNSSLKGHNVEGVMLTDSQYNIVSRIKRRLSNKEIATELSIEDVTVKFHLTNIFKRFDVEDRYQVAEIVKNFDFGEDKNG